MGDNLRKRVFDCGETDPLIRLPRIRVKLRRYFLGLRLRLSPDSQLRRWRVVGF
jgi:hypothetical protein